ncbi:glycerol-3-phosphate dehydrogenase [Campylobacter vulpis]|uniref:Glycerol-3-phosphate dehydrogenase [NAD(P)+] n=1 Tax=Campylobacter vulpis TaxID=1655500 RepID=A0A2G4R750_9BACT|nr:NAD(P)H-dependent glycerol-3-phosphate dehydrogenase [Campylobacter vulpis]MBS4236245.1 NAD(P)H-dependent glycerol-3-phosphate dehydrogenase [Campylobacter vulpis]MBS4241681.1 NAD(P)H-dependent glycerol-3-phosphate dehydrogenase [Campylobacter vulpis]MBS4269882.1 NAD(P)H-dependent glycerol-3-phosphate dehydrogenase [Campylobacter vulpis]MBS4276116.1 NAD(P)H-dependent glycerol-3-phosphate dehydrogenase [Campylobacter vulpis]MBS4307500.1 NAD(P)H-dependent glycerol-3-phosphate dehydrogenase [C
MSSIAVIGAGKWGSALYHALNAKNPCFISSPTPRKMANFIPIEEALKCEYLIFALSSQALHTWLQTHFKNQNAKVLIASKGIEAKTGLFLDEIFKEFLDESQICVLSGPSFAAEVEKHLPTALMINGKNLTLCKEFANFFPPFIKTYIDDDVRGAEICGAYKNVLAIASGICDGLKLGNNARASLISRGLIEMHRFGKFFQAKEETFLGLSGAGDLFLTASSVLSRNYRVGLMLAQNKNLQEILQTLGEVAEGVETAFAIEKLAKENQIYTPIVSEVARILEGKSVKNSVEKLLKQSDWI